MLSSWTCELGYANHFSLEIFFCNGDECVQVRLVIIKKAASELLASVEEDCILIKKFISLLKATLLHANWRRNANDIQKYDFFARNTLCEGDFPTINRSKGCEVFMFAVNATLTMKLRF